MNAFKLFGFVSAKGKHEDANNLNAFKLFGFVSAKDKHERQTI